LANDLGPRLGDSPLSALRNVLDLGLPGVALEFGVATGRTLRLIAECMPVFGFDSFEGLPEDWRAGFPAGMFACIEPMVRGAEIVVGRFEDTLPGYVWPEKIGLVHLDADLYSSTRTVLDHLDKHLEVGTVVVFDEWHGYPGCELHEQRAWREFAERTGWAMDVIGHGPEQLACRLA